MTGNTFSSIPLEELYVQLHSSSKGISDSVAEERIKVQRDFFKAPPRYKKELKLLVRQFSNPLVLLLVIAVILSAILGEASDSLIILSILVFTGILGFWQEVKAGRAMEKLRQMIEMRHTVMRNGHEKQLPTHQIVPGDILIFDAGDIIPADCRLIESNELHVNESSLTGETFPAEKSPGIVPGEVSLGKKNNCLWQGTHVISGSATALVVLTGSQTIFGQMSQSLVQIHETAFEKGIRRFGFFLLRITIVLSIVILLANLYFKKPFFDAVLFSLALAVGMAPELLPAIMTFAMSVGAKRMLKKKVIVKKLSSIFNFGELNVLCTDKTGTITEGEVRVKDIVDVNGKPNERLRLFACLNAQLQQGFTNPIDAAISSLKVPLDGYNKLNEIPYDFVRKRLSVAIKYNHTCFVVTKGAFSNVLEVCDSIEYETGNVQLLEKEIRNKLEKKFINYSQQGYRVLGLAYKQIQKEKFNRAEEEQMTFLGFILFEDPLKQSTLTSIQRLNQLHIEVKIITGDNRFSALHTSLNIGMTDPVILTGEELDLLNPEAFIVRVKQTNIFAEIEPRQKERIIKALQKSNLTVGYVGDGINDVAAINAADIGISTNNAADVAKEAADFVLLEKDLSVLADGITEGRRSFVNSMKYIFISTGATFGNMLSVAGASLFLPFLPMLPKQILLTNLITDLPFLTIASDQVDKDQLTDPGKWNLKMIRNFMIVFGLHSSIFDFITFYILYFYFRLSNSTFQTGWFLESAITELLILYIIRTRKSFIKSKPGKWLLVTGIIAFCITAYLPLSPFANTFGFSVAHANQLIAIALILVVYTITADLLKIIFFRMKERNHL
jgi:Mg2+-importing ATPase